MPRWCASKFALTARAWPVCWKCPCLAFGARPPHAQLEDFDDGVVYQLAAKKNEEEALGALRTLAENDVSGIQHLAAYINHGGCCEHHAAHSTHRPWCVLATPRSAHQL